MRRIITAAAVAGVLAVGANAQQATTEQKSRMKGNNGTAVTLTGCLHSSGDAFVLTNVSQEGTAIESLLDSPVVLRRASDSIVDLSGHVGHRVTIAGAMPKAGAEKSKADQGPEVKGKKKMKYAADPEGRPVVLVTSLTHVSPTCP